MSLLRDMFILTWQRRPRRCSSDAMGSLSFRWYTTSASPSWYRKEELDAFDDGLWPQCESPIVGHECVVCRNVFCKHPALVKLREYR